MLGPLAPLWLGTVLRALHMSAPALWVWVDLACFGGFSHGGGARAGLRVIAKSAFL